LEPTGHYFIQSIQYTPQSVSEMITRGNDLPCEPWRAAWEFAEEHDAGAVAVQRGTERPAVELLFVLTQQDPLENLRDAMPAAKPLAFTDNFYDDDRLVARRLPVLA
jgi:hypothetical protein